jgi:membrane protease subunit HflK
MSNDTHSHPHPAPQAPLPEETGSRALAEALSTSFSLVKLVMIGLVVVFLVSNFFIVGPQERAIILRLGKPVGEGKEVLLGPGLHFALPYPLDVVKRIPITELQKVTSTVGWYATTPEQEQAGQEPPPMPYLDPNSQGYVLTAERNILHARAELTYLITDPVRFVLDFTNAPAALRDALDNALVRTAARSPVDLMITNRSAVNEAVAREVNLLVEARQLGVSVDRCDVETRPPLVLKEAFGQVLNAQVNGGGEIAAARGYRTDTTNRASTTAFMLINQAESHRRNLVEGTAGEARRFLELLPQYQANPDLLQQQRYNEVVSKVISNAQEQVFLASRPDGQPRELRLLLSRDPNREKPKPPVQP